LRSAVTSGRSKGARGQLSREFYKMEKPMKNTKTQRLEALAKVISSKDQVFWRKVGVAFPLKKRPGYSLKLEFMPAPTDGAFEFILVEPSASKKTGEE